MNEIRSEIAIGVSFLTFFFLNAKRWVYTNIICTKYDPNILC